MAMTSSPGVARRQNPVADGSDEPKEVLGVGMLYREWGYRALKAEKYWTAAKAFEKSWDEGDSDDLRTLLGLSIAYSHSTKYTEAAAVIDKCMEIDPQNLRVKWRRVETLFDVAEFGYSLIHAHQGRHQQRYPFELGVFQGNEAVEDCIGRNTSPTILWELYPWIRDVQEQQRELIAKLGEEEDEFEGIDDENARFKVNDPGAKLAAHLKQLNRVQAAIYLGLLAADKHAMEDILEKNDIESANVEGSELLRWFAKRSFVKSCYRQDVLRMRRPFYAYRSTRKGRPPGRKAAIRYERKIRQNNLVIAANCMLLRLHAARKSRDYQLFFHCLDRARMKFDAHSDAMFPVKAKCLKAINEMASWAYMDSRNLTCLPDDEVKERYLKHHLGIRVAELPRDSDIGWVATVHKKEALRAFRQRLALASDVLDQAWLLHDLSKLFAEMRRYDLAKFYAKKARDASVEAADERWALNANHLLIRIELSQHNRNEAREVAQLALLNAMRLGIDHLVDFYHSAIKLVDRVDFEATSAADSITKREQLILSLMPAEFIDQVDFLLRSMNSVPAERRLSVMPGCKPVNREFKLACKRNTILTAPPKSPEKEARKALLEHFAPTPRVLGWMDFEDYE